MSEYKIEIKWAVVFSVMMLAWMVLERLTGLHDQHIDQHATFTNFVSVPAIGIYVLALLDKRRQCHRGHMSYGQGVKAGLFLTLFVTALTPLVQWLTSTFITPDFFANASRYAVQTKQLSSAAAAEYFTLKSYLLQGVIGSFVMGLITTLVVAAFTRQAAKAQLAGG